MWRCLIKNVGAGFHACPKEENKEEIMKNCISIKLTKEEIRIEIKEQATEEQIVECLKKKLTELKKLYKEEKTPILVTGKVLKNKEIEEIKELIQEQIDVEIKFDSPKDLGLSSIKRVFNREIETSETKFYKGSLRSGQKIEFEGSLVILGDVNAGSEVMAGDHVIVLGTLRGLAHAGAKGNKKAIIAAEKIEAPQIRIANVVKEMERKEGEEEKVQKYAYVEGEEMIIE